MTKKASTKVTSIRITDTEKAFLLRWGNGNLTAAIRSLIKFATAHLDPKKPKHPNSREETK